MNSYIESLHWRYATKSFDISKKVTEADLEFLKKAVQLSASSYGLQPYKVLVIESKELREALKPLSWNQTQITDASHLFLFANNTQMKGEEVDGFINEVERVRNIERQKLENYSAFVKSKTTTLSPEEKSHWTAKQAYIALGNLLSAAAFLRIDTCAIEGFEKEKVNELLNLKTKGYSTAFMVAIGYRSENDHNQFLKKVRTPMHQLFETL